MKEYIKIETLFKRDVEGTKKLLFGEFRNPTVEFLKDNLWQFTEKVDGTNIRVYWDGHTVTFGGRTARADIPAPLVNYLNSVFKTSEAEQIFEELFGEKEVILFGEGYGPCIQRGGNYRKDVSFIMFDTMISDNYQPRETVEATAKAFGVDVVPVLFEGTLQDGIDYVLHHPASVVASADLPSYAMEGIVGRPKLELQDRCGNRVIVKIKWEDFKDFAN